MINSGFHDESNNQAMSLEQLSDVNGAGLENKYAKLLKPKAKKIKMQKFFTLKDVMNGGGIPGPYLPTLTYINQQTLNPGNQWM